MSEELTHYMEACSRLHERIRTLEGLLDSYRAEVERLNAENGRLTGIIQETYTSAEEDHRRLFEVLAETERLRAEWKDSDEQFQHAYAQRVDEMNAAEARVRELEAEVKRLREENAVLRPGAENYNRVRVERDAAQAEVERLREELGKAWDHCVTECGGQIKAAQARVRELEAEVARLTYCI